MKALLLLLHILCVIATNSATEHGAGFEFPEDALISDEVHYGFNIGSNNERQSSKVTIGPEKKRWTRLSTTTTVRCLSTVKYKVVM